MGQMQKPLHDILSEIVGPDKCYFDPPATMNMKYPCIRYIYSNDVDTYADNKHYLMARRYIVTVIDENPDSKIPEKLRELPYCTSDRNYTVDGLNHFTFILYYRGPRIGDQNKEE